MSGGCETKMLPHLQESLQASANGAVPSLGGPNQSISYEGRLSLISQSFSQASNNGTSADTTNSNFFGLLTNKILQNSQMNNGRPTSNDQAKPDQPEVLDVENGTIKTEEPESMPDCSSEGMDYSDNEIEEINREQNEIICKECQNVFQSPLLLSQHMLQYHQLAYCNLCTMTFQSSSEYEGHMAEHKSNSRSKAKGNDKDKIYRCKKCDHVSYTKEDSWAHSAMHMNPDKILRCTSCSFITMYKHHLDYHVKNHKGDRPHKCPHCDYTCVNKSMLNSHMKSHSKIRTFHCKDCDYSTKYMHSLKLHLRKAKHNPAMVLNPDGTPNPIPIIDIYGRKRGPKLKRDEQGNTIIPPKYQSKVQQVKATMELTGTLPMAPMPSADPHSTSAISNSHFNTKPIFSNEFPTSQNPTFSPSPSFPFPSTSPMTTDSPSPPRLQCNQCQYSTYNYQSYLCHLSIHGKPSSQKLQFTNPDTTHPLTQASLFLSQGLNMRAPMPNPSPGVLDFLAFNNPLLSSLFQLPYPFMNRNTSNEIISPVTSPQPEKTNLTSGRAVEVSRSRPETPEAGETSILGAALDLSREQMPKLPSDMSLTPKTDSPPSTTVSPPTSDTSTPPTKNRRKAPPFKLGRVPLNLSVMDDNKSTIPGNRVREADSPSKSCSSHVPKVKKRNWEQSYICHHCDIAYMNSQLWSIHMGCHDRRDPFICNMCGTNTKESVAFNVHIGKCM